MQARELPAQVQPQARTGQVVRFRRRHATEPGEEDRHVLFRDAKSVVSHADPCDAAPARELDLDRAAGRRIFDRVADQVGDDGLDPLTVDAYLDWALGALELDLVLVLDQRPGRIDRGADDAAEV